MELLKNGLSIRGDHYYCPLSFQLDTYWNCENECHHCYLRRLNRTWGKELKPIDINLFKKKLESGLKNNNPQSSLACAIKNKKTIRLGNKTDPYQMAELKYKVTSQVIDILLEYDWTFLIQTKFTNNLLKDIEKMIKKVKNISIMPIISPGLERDWEILEKKGTTNPIERIKHLSDLQEKGFNVGINGEPFIAGYHTIQDFKNTLKILKEYKIKSYNTYHLHMNDWNLKNLHTIGLDIEKIYNMNQDENWKPILTELIEIAKKEDIILGCPDFVNSGEYQENVNTCCGMNVPNPCSFNIINWKKLYMKGIVDTEKIIEISWDGIGNKDEARKLLNGKHKKFYSLNDCLELKKINLF